MAGKDPAFLFYSKDWLEGTAEMTPDEKGVYVDLLAHQHQKGSLPPETKRLAKLAGISESEFLLIWKDLATKFLPNGSGRLVNRKLNGIVSERQDKGWRNKIIGTLASIIRYSGQTYETNAKVKKTFKVDDFLACTDQNLTEQVTEWYKKRLKSIGNANEDANAIENEIKEEKEGVGEKEEQSTDDAYLELIVPAMQKVWKKSHPQYAFDKQKDYPALLKLSYFIVQQEGMNKNSITNSKKVIIEIFETISSFVSQDSFFKNYSISQVEKHIQSITSSIQNGKSKQATGGEVNTQSAFDKIDKLYSIPGTHR